jgi:hypothetical protein
MVLCNWFYWCLSHFQHEFRYIVMLSLIGGGNGSAGKKRTSPRAEIEHPIVRMMV